MEKFNIRPFTDDFSNFESVIHHNEYRLPPCYPVEARIIDIGAHIGTFAAAVYRRGARWIYCYEADHGNFQMLRKNMEDLGENAKALCCAVWRSDKRVSWLRFRPSENMTRTGGGNVLRDYGQEVIAIPLDQIIDDVTRKGDRVHTLKLDCEGSEWPILLTSNRLGLVDRIIGEYHEIGGPNMEYVREGQAHPTEIPEIAQVGKYGIYTIEVLAKYLMDQGFMIQHIPAKENPWLGKFWAKRTELIEAFD